MATSIIGPISWSMTRDEMGFREYKIKFNVKGSTSDGPGTVMLTPGLPLPGSFWAYGNDVDIWCWCRPNMTITPVLEKEPNQYWIVECTFSNKPLPPNQRQRCQDNQTEDPLLEPQGVGGSFVNKSVEASFDRLGPIRNSSWEQIRGPRVEFDDASPTVEIEQNVAILNLTLCASMMNTVNTSVLWGFQPRCIKLSRFTWEQKYYGQCYIYYTRKFGFDINYNTFDRAILDEGAKALHGENSNGNWVITPMIKGSTNPADLPNPQNPNHFVRYTDARANPCRVILDGAGRPVDPDPGTSGASSVPGTTLIEKYNESNLLLLGIPAFIG